MSANSWVSKGKVVVVTVLLLGLMLAPAGGAHAKTSPQEFIARLPAGLAPVYLETLPALESSGGLTADFGPESVMFSPIGSAAGKDKKKDGKNWAWGLSLNAWGSGSETQPVEGAKVSRRGAKVNYKRGDLTEWYVSSAIGVEQGFTVRKAPRQGKGSLTLRMAVLGGLEGVVSVDGRGASFSTPDGATLHYDSLRAYDSTGKELDARMSLGDGQIVIRVDDRGAKYPVTIDPLIYLEGQLFASDPAAGDNFGWSVAVSGDTALVGAPFKSASAGAAYVFTRSGSTWTQKQKLTASDAAAGDSFGISVALSGDTAVVGAYIDDLAGPTIFNAGSAYVFTRSGTIWTEQQKLTASDPAATDSFGRSVAVSPGSGVSGDTVLVGAPYANLAGPIADAGATYVFTRTGTTWTEQQKLTAFDPAVNNNFGFAVTLSGDTALVGAYQADLPGPINDAGAAYVFTRSGTIWSFQQKLIDPTPAQTGRFGQAVEMKGDNALIGAPGKSGLTGAAYVFTRSGTTWTVQGGPLTASDGTFSNFFGQSVALNGDTALVGAEGNSGNIGAAYVFTRSGTTWTEKKKLAASDGLAGDQFGFAVALDGVALVGANVRDLPGKPDAGSAYVYYPYNTDADLDVTASVDKANAFELDTLIYTVSVTNLGGSPADAVNVSASLPEFVSFTSALANPGTSYDSDTGNWDVGGLALGASATLILQGAIDEGATGASLSMTATLVGRDMNAANNIASASTNVVIDAALNGGMETDTAKPLGSPDTWKGKSLVAATDKLDTTVLHLGAKSMKLTGQAKKTKTLAETLADPIDEGAPVTVSAWVRGQDIPSAGQFRLVMQLYAGKTVKTYALKFLGKTFDWTYASKTVIAPFDVTKVVLTIKSTKAAGVMWIDDVSLVHP